MRGSDNEGSKWGWQREQAAITSARREQQQVGLNEGGCDVLAATMSAGGQQQ